MTKPNQQKVRRSIREWLFSHNYAIRALAREAGIQASSISRFLNGETTLESGTALKLYKVFHRTMTLVERQDFLDAAGLILLPAESVLANDQLIIADNCILDSLSVEPYELGTRLMAAGMRFDYEMNLWEKAALCFSEAEKRFAGISKNMPATAACLVAQQYVNLGDYRKAQKELLRVFSSYSMDAETRYEWHRIKGWLAYLCADLRKSETCFKECLEIANLAALAYPAAQAHHWLGRIYCRIGASLRQEQEKNAYYQKAQYHFQKAFDIHRRQGNEWWMAFDLFRKSQLFLAQGKGEESHMLRKMSRSLFGKHRAILHIDMEEARIAFENGETKMPVCKAEEILRGWGEVKYAKGMADALQVLGETASIRLDRLKALELYVAALCIYPFENYPGNRELWERIDRYRKKILETKNGKINYERLTDRICGLIEGKEGYFSFLNKVSADRSEDIATILEKLRRNN